MHPILHLFPHSLHSWLKEASPLDHRLREGTGEGALPFCDLTPDPGSPEHCSLNSQI